MLFFQLLFLMLSLVVIGEPLRFVFSRYSGLFGKLDILQILVLDVYLGGFILYAIAIVPFRLFNSTVIWVVLLFSIFFVAVSYSLKLKKKQLKLPDKSDVFCQVVVVAISLLVLWIGVSSTTNLIFGNVHDSSLFALFAQVILENQQIPQTLQPYSTNGIIYPQGYFVVVAFARILPLNFSLAEIPLLITPFFQAFTVIGAYHLGKALSGRKLAISLAFIFAFVSRWPRLIMWGANGFIFGFPLYFISLSLVPSLLGSKTWNKSRVIDLFIAGILYGYLAAVHLTLYTALILSLAIGIMISVFWGHEAIRSKLRSARACIYALRNFLFVVMASLIVISVFVFRGVMWYPYPGHNIGLPTDITVEPYPSFLPINWLIYSEGISPYPLLMLETLLLLGASVTALIYGWRLVNMKGVLKVVMLSIAGTTALFSMSLLQYIFPSFEIYLGEPARPIILLLVSSFILIGMLNVIIYGSLRNFIHDKFKLKFPEKTRLNFGAVALAAILVFSFIYTPYVYYTLYYDAGYMIQQYNLFCVTTRDDLELMQWMRENLTKEATILINPYDAGGFIPVVSNLKVIYPFTASRSSKAYRTLTNLISQNVLNVTTYELIKHLNVSYIFVGSRAVAGFSSWDAMLFLNNPNFMLVKNIGTSYLFRRLFEDFIIDFQDDFEYTNISEGGWQFIVPKEVEDNGAGYAFLSSEYAPHGAHSLMMTAEKSNGLYYTNWVFRKVYLLDKPGTTLSFYINSNTSSLYDYVAVVVSDSTWHNKVYFASPNLNPWEEMITMSASQGFFTFNLSQTWHERFNSTLPTLIYIVVQITDFDGIKDTGFVDYITVKSEVSNA